MTVIYKSNVWVNGTTQPLSKIAVIIDVPFRIPCRNIPAIFVILLCVMYY